MSLNCFTRIAVVCNNDQSILQRHADLVMLVDGEDSYRCKSQIRRECGAATLRQARSDLPLNSSSSCDGCLTTWDMRVTRPSIHTTGR